MFCEMILIGYNIKSVKKFEILLLDFNEMILLLFTLYSLIFFSSFLFSLLLFFS